MPEIAEASEASEDTYREGSDIQHLLAIASVGLHGHLPILQSGPTRAAPAGRGREE
jgi:hypothetical protein